MQIFASVAQSVEQLICNQRVGGSNPLAGSRNRGLVLPGTALVFLVMNGQVPKSGQMGRAVNPLR